ncbi:hypothetical protein H0H93_006163 [Arthromyces matolae]|nr:hypothetical protein H0H93_006163 [Arthromyces matolae]
MIIIRPRILISASLISLALLLVSATPIHSLAVPRAVTNDLVRTDSAIPPSVTKLFGRATGDYRRLQELRQSMYDASTKGCNNPDHLVYNLNQYASLAQQQGAEDIAHTTLSATRLVKLIVAAWNPDQRQQGIHGIMACEAAVTKDLSENLSWRKSPPQVKMFLDDDLKPLLDNPSRSMQFRRLEDMVTYITFLTLKEQCTISKELEDGYDTIHDKVKQWADDEWKRLAMEELKKWNFLNSLVHGI